MQLVCIFFHIWWIAAENYIFNFPRQCSNMPKVRRVMSNEFSSKFHTLASSAKIFWKSVKIWQSYREFKGGNFFETQCIRNFPLLPSGVCIAPTDLTVGETDLPEVWYCDTPIIGPWLFVFDFRSSAAVQNYGGLKTIGVEILDKIWDILPPVKWVQHGSNVCGYFMSSAWGPTLGIVSAGACWADSHL